MILILQCECIISKKEKKKKEDSATYSKISAISWKYYKNKPNDNITHSESLQPKEKIKRSTPCWC